MIPSFSIMGMSLNFENMAKRIQDFSNVQQQTDNMKDLVLELGDVCMQACGELEVELNKIKMGNA
jgi:hypothetical protein